MKFRIVVLLLAFITVVTGCANIEKEESKVTQKNVIQDGPELLPLGESAALIAGDNEVVNFPISGPNFTKDFNIPAHFGWVKVWVHNTSSETLRVRVTQSTITGTEKMFFEVAPGAQKAVNVTQPWATGTHWVAISTKNGGNMSGFLSVKLENTKEEPKKM
ncbi:hypothetical protein [Paenibacillus sp. LHD-38]|uniref:hypothetical protein n=1 Tax=Paenibacillus sp. LHD-38 TaxID=3072143 RepID=UPI00280F5167|nr:hypothetical protein [Paenibacillus sp. LHD-38]MDQ8738235.1 hypothetical protein [Paenibacillus sp. LHD-38]